jgi:hypothetical protein
LGGCVRGQRAPVTARSSELLHKDEAFALWLICGAPRAPQKAFPQADPKQIGASRRPARKICEGFLNGC